MGVCGHLCLPPFTSEADIQNVETKCPKRVVFCRFALTVARQHSGNELLRQVNGQYERVAITGIRGLMAFADRVLQ
jgi:hypothetical protein